MHLLSNKLVTEMLRLNCFNKISGIFFINECELRTRALFDSFCRFEPAESVSCNPNSIY